MLTKLAVTALTFAASAQAAVSILYPNSNTVWYKNNTVHMNWTLTTPETDTYLFRAYLSNGDQSVLAGNHSIADSTSATAQDVRILLPQIPAGEGYIVNLVNTTNEAQVFATSEPFEIADGIVTTSSTSTSSTGSATGTSGGNIPNAKTTSQNPFPSASSASPSSSSSSTSAATPDISLDALMWNGLMIFSIGLGAAVAL
uniref:Ser-Thr-rich glycosyl-phosphatidyl-inositol-anchored membrane family-domain-containing protein n=1 Tax=Kwoniella bestiolae CBS 10118 TaxID=1296100 RepID=A0A1B9FVQ8_9TREE|nr:hypothetical protein I302_07204 [Kwoniella bestiolae CBS 10118]OCF22859.1 hypothetical protein I302_07204 [Kwoniella bestiolae CBS 10118]